MAIEKVKCKQCGKKFYGTARAMFCSKACKQKDYRNKVKSDDTKI